MLLHVAKPSRTMIAGMQAVLATRCDSAQTSAEDAIAIFEAVLDLAASAYLEERPASPVDLSGADEQLASRLPESGSAATHPDALDWACRTAEHVRTSFDGAPTSLRMWSFRDRIEALRLRFASPGRPSIDVTLCAGGQFSFGDGHAFVSDMAEAIHVAGILARKVGIGIVSLGHEPEEALSRENGREKPIDAGENAGSSTRAERRCEEMSAAAISAFDSSDLATWVKAVRCLVACRLRSTGLSMILQGAPGTAALEATIGDGSDRMVLSFPIGSDPSGRNLNHALNALAELASALRADLLLAPTSDTLNVLRPDRRR